LEIKSIVFVYVFNIQKKTCRDVFSGLLEKKVLLFEFYEKKFLFFVSYSSIL